jgi:hypothetical protein
LVRILVVRCGSARLSREQAALVKTSQARVSVHVHVTGDNGPSACRANSCPYPERPTT